MHRLQQLQNWYASQCDGEWEHQYGISIQSLDNPGWWVKIHVAGTAMEQVAFVAVSERRSRGDWLDCKVADRVFEGAGDASKLEAILGVFLDWVEQEH